MKLKRFANVVEHAGSGLRVPEEIARKIDRLSRGLPKDFGFRRMAKAPSAFRIEALEDGSRSDVSTITTDGVDRDNEVILPKGIDLTDYRSNPIVCFAHRYDTLPVGKCLSITDAPGGLVARTKYGNRPQSWPGEWLPDAILSLMQEGICRGKSIGFIPTSMRSPTGAEIARRPELKDVSRVIDGATLIEYSVVPIPCNPQALAVAVSKSVHDESLRHLFLESMPEKSMSGHQPAILAPIPSHHVGKLKAMAGKVKDEALADKGREKTFHCTIDSHLKTEDLEAIKNAVAGSGPLKFTLGKVSHFPADGHRNHDVVKIDADGPELKALHAKLKTALPHSTNLPYRPHVTLAYVKPGCGKDYDGMDGADGLSMTCKSLTFSDHSGQHYTIPLEASSLKTMGENNNAAGGTVVQPGAGVVADNSPSENGTDVPPCPKCMNNQRVEQTGVAQYKCTRCNTPFAAAQAGGDAWAAEHPELLAGKSKAAKSIQVNQACVTRALKLVSEGKVDSGAAAAPNGGDRTDADCLAFDTTKPEGSAGRRKYPVIVDGSVKSHLVQNAEARATQNGAAGVAKAARRIMAAIQAREKALSNLPKLIPAAEADRLRQQKQIEDARDLVRRELESFVVLETGFKRVI